MKAKICQPRTAGAIKEGGVKKSHSTHVIDGEMASYFAKLRDLVPTIPNDKKVSKVQLLQHVIDYIFDLEMTLELDCSPCLPSEGRTPLGENPMNLPFHRLTVSCLFDVKRRLIRLIYKRRLFEITSYDSAVQTNSAYENIAGVPDDACL